MSSVASHLEMGQTITFATLSNFVSCAGGSMIIEKQKLGIKAFDINKTKNWSKLTMGQDYFTMRQPSQIIYNITSLNFALTSNCSVNCLYHSTTSTKSNC